MPRQIRSRKLPSTDTRHKILEVAALQFARGGYRGVGMRRLAADLDLSKSALFHHFPTKLQLYEEVLNHVLERLESALQALSQPLGGPVQRLEVWIDSIQFCLAADRPTARLLLRTLLGEEPVADFFLEPRATARSVRPWEERLGRILGGLGPCWGRV